MVNRTFQEVLNVIYDNKGNAIIYEIDRSGIRMRTRASRIDLGSGEDKGEVIHYYGFFATPSNREIINNLMNDIQEVNFLK